MVRRTINAQEALPQGKGVIMDAIHAWKNPRSVYSTAVELAQAVFAGSMPGAGEPPEHRPVAVEPAPRLGLFARVSRWMREERQRELEAYLAASQDLCDLERRLRNFERRTRF